MAHLPEEGRPWVIEGKHHNNVLIARAVVTPTNNNIPIRNSNTSFLVTLYQGMKLATAELFSEANINGVTEAGSQNKWQHMASEQDKVALQVPLPGKLMTLDVPTF